jgi:hypothetical protein
LAIAPLTFAPGEAYQFDWSHEVVLLSGVTVIVKAAHVRLCHSRMLFVRAYPRETQEMVNQIPPRTILLWVDVISPPLERALLNCSPYIRDWIGKERD